MIVVYSKPNCPYCIRAKDWLNQNTIPFKEVDITVDPCDYNFLIDEGHKSVPQIYARDGYGALKLLVEGGYTGLAALTAEEIAQRLANQ